MTLSPRALKVSTLYYKRKLYNKRVEQDPEGESVGAEGSPKEAPAPRKAPQVVAGGSKAASPTETTH